jgi:DNA-binding IclR family transcriptional regulator
MSNTLQSVERALRILLSFETEVQEASVSELAAMLGVHKSTASRLAATLSAHGMLERAPGSERFRLGPELGRLGMLAVGGRDLIEAARSSMAGLAGVTGETVTLAVRDGAEMASVAQVDSRYVVGVQKWVGRRTPLHCTSDGKVMLAFGEIGLPEGPLEARTNHTIISPAALERQLAQIRERGWATALGELEEGLNGVAVPVFDAGRRCVAGLSVSGPSYRVTPDHLPPLARHCVEAATKISMQLAWSSNGA